ncbi:MAG: Stp1/IreP family PP2C-type Ser/Thr phosphatase [Gammaproteobacteria bacterium]|nr:Stp1/IreP family PP2C-type Ser/Thr phosphatase [Gammaproteobacteria bacterium]
MSCALTHVGHVRTTNEDAFLESNELCLWAVADGMGGHAAGDVASKMVVDCLASFAPFDHVSDSIDSLEDRLIDANRECLSKVENDAIHQGMGSTAAVLFASGKHCFVLWAGDSRIYRLREGQLQQLTEDHSLVQEMYALGHLTEEELATHPSANIITRAVGVAEHLFVDIDYSEVYDGDRFLLCSDGLTRDLRDPDVEKLLAEGSPTQACEALLRAALDRGGGDNTTVIVVESAGL